MDRKKLIGITALVSACAIWGIGFVPQRTAMQYTGPFTFNAARFFLAACVMGLFLAFNHKLKLSKVDIKNGSILGTILFCGITCQQIGMISTSASNGGFITTLYLVIVPVQLTLFFGKKFSPLIWLAVLLSLVGLAFLSLNDELKINPGDYWIMLCALIFAQHIILIDRLMKSAEPLVMAFLQYIVAAAISTIVALSIELHLFSGLKSVLPQLAYSGLISVGFGYTAQLYGQRFIPPTQAALFFSLEAIFAAFAGWLLLNETLTGLQFLGCCLIFTALIIACLNTENNPVPKDLDAH